MVIHDATYLLRNKLEPVRDVVIVESEAKVLLIAQLLQIHIVKGYKIFLIQIFALCTCNVPNSRESMRVCHRQNEHNDCIPLGQNPFGTQSRSNCYYKASLG